MIYLYSGTPGSGKSLHIARMILNNNRDKVPIVSNLKIDEKQLKYPELYFYIELYEMSASKIVYWWYTHRELIGKKEGSCLFIVDECQRIFNSRDYNAKDRRAWLDFFTLHRHFLFNVILVSQWDYMLDKQIRPLIEIECKHKQAKSLGKFGRLLNWLYFGTFGNKLFVYSSNFYTSKMKTSLNFFSLWFSPKNLYNTHEIYLHDLPKNLADELRKNNISLDD